jgi:UDP-glucose 4-epimerase
MCITGGSGVLGRALVRSALERGWQVRVLDPTPFPDRPLVEASAAGHFDQVPGRVDDPDALGTALDGASVVVHLAARLPQAALSEAAYREANVEDTLRVARAAASKGVRRMLFASTIEVYGAQPVAAPLREDAPLRFTGVYSRTKYESEQCLLECRRTLGIETCSLRMPMVMGEGFHHEKTILRVFHALRRGLPIPVPGPDCLVSFVSARDAAQAFDLAATVPGADGRVLNVAAADSPTMLAFLRDVADAVGSRARMVAVPRPLGRAGLALAKRIGALRGGKLGGTPVELMEFAMVGGAYSIEAARQVLGYAPQDSTVDAWAATYRWFLSR